MGIWPQYSTFLGRYFGREATVVSRASYICGSGDENRYTEGGRGYEETIACSTTQVGARRDIAATRAGIVD